MIYPKSIAALIEQFQKFPSVGPKSAQRMAFFLLRMSKNDVENFAKTIIEAKANTKTCEICFNISNTSPCEICSSNSRDRSTICVVSESKDLIAIEKTNEYKGLYHVLQGLISPLDGIGAEDIRIKELLNRLTDESIKEVILALNPSVEGEATSLYLTKLIKPFGIKVSRIAFGLPVGADLEYADEITIAKAIEGRHEI
ncbi:MAG TPA: recombination protein RecR [Cyanobacteria bacterium UBA11991]|nr:recombination mediator RecR [Cyanobacteriota bacterium]MDY6358514.1 recombination mediator RecR [Cyanobacteriota bacterium]MDY6364194.1 recombination mediator RecR [Cyanobacteriota bacterium]MDY6383645.1 recombination mediator RecR [Cyanobacteriota bacterium]HCB11437.1 recombination protein RecR [Cyanobacteria bacterium UBA11991]